MTVRVPDLVGEPIVGYRMWLVDARRQTSRGWRRAGRNPHFGALCSWNWPDLLPKPWAGDGALHAECAAKPDPPHPAPSAGCRCGVWAMKGLREFEKVILVKLAGELLDSAKQYWPGIPPYAEQGPWIAVGKVKLWGTLIEGTRGYRSEFAYPSEVWLLPPARLGGWLSREQEQVEHELVVDMLRTLRGRYRCHIGYAEHSPELAQLLRGYQLGRFYCWRLTHTGSDRLSSMLGDEGLAARGAVDVRALLALWLADYRASDDTHERAESVIHRFINPALGHLRTHQVSTAIVADYHRRVRENGLAARTVARHRTILRGAFAYAVERSWMSINPAVPSR